MIQTRQKQQRGSSGGATRSGFSNFQVVFLILFILIVERVLYPPNLSMSESMAKLTSAQQQQSANSANTNAYTNIITNTGDIPYEQHTSPLGIPQGKAVNLPSIRIDEEQDQKVERNIYGGKGDKAHLGGFTDIDVQGLAPAVWTHLVKNWTVQSVIDVGCGRGISTSWFVTHGLRTECVEGSHDAIEKSMVPDKSILTEHDFSRGPWWPEKTFDVAWSVEFLEHVNLQFHYNYVSVFRKAALILVTSSKWGGWHHVEVHKDDWWIRKYEAYGLKYDDKLTQQIRQIASLDRSVRSREIFPPTGKRESYFGQHIYTTMKVFVNPVRVRNSDIYFLFLPFRTRDIIVCSQIPNLLFIPHQTKLQTKKQAVAALPEHAHLFGAPGCFQSTGLPNRECGVPATPRQKQTAATETRLDPSYYPLKLTPQQDEAWINIVKAHVPKPEPQPQPNIQKRKIPSNATGDALIEAFLPPKNGGR